MKASINLEGTPEEIKKYLELFRTIYKGTPIRHAGLSERTLECILRSGYNINTLEDIKECSEAKMASIKGFGKKAMAEVREKLRLKGLSLKGD